MPEFLCYDDGCHLRKYARNDKRKDMTPTTNFLAQLEIVVDKMHMKGHVDKWCQSTCDPNLFSKLDNVSQLIHNCNINQVLESVMLAQWRLPVHSLKCHRNLSFSL